MKNKTFTTTVDKNGCISIPVTILNEIGLSLGDTIYMNYDVPAEAIEKCMYIENVNQDENLEMYLCIPKEILEDCGIPIEDGKAHLLCFEKEITITSEDKIISEVPKAVLNLCKRLNISEKELAKAVAEECCKYG